MSVAAAQAHHGTERSGPTPHKTVCYRERLPIRKCENGEPGGFHAVLGVQRSKINKYFPYLVSYWDATTMDNNTRPMASFNPESPFPRQPAGQFEPTSPLPVADLKAVRVLDPILFCPGSLPLLLNHRG